MKLDFGEKAEALNLFDARRHRHGKAHLYHPAVKENDR